MQLFSFSGRNLSRGLNISSWGYTIFFFNTDFKSSPKHILLYWPRAPLCKVISRSDDPAPRKHPQKVGFAWPVRPEGRVTHGWIQKNLAKIAWWILTESYLPYGNEVCETSKLCSVCSPHVMCFGDCGHTNYFLLTTLHLILDSGIN